MSLKQADRVADGLDKASLQEDSIGATTSEEFLGTVDKSPSQYATLLGIPQELRNTKFEYVYATPDSTGDRVRLTVTDPSERTSDVEAFISFSQAPPSKNPLLVCSQLYTEMGKMQARAFRHYRSKVTFETTTIYQYSASADTVYAVDNRDLRHAENIVLLAACWDLIVEVECLLRNGSWNAFFNVSCDLWKTTCRSKGWLPSNAAPPQGLQRLVHFDYQVRGGLKEFHPNIRSVISTVDPGFAANDVYNASAIVEDWIVLGPRAGWATV